MHFTVTAEDLENANQLGTSIADSTVQHDIITTNLAAIIAKNILGKNYNVDTESRIGNIQQIASKYELSDVYVNGHCIDIRLSFNSQSLRISKEALKCGLIPCAYMFVQLSEDLSEGNLLGFLSPLDIIDDESDDEYITIDQNSLKDYDSLGEILTTDDNLGTPNNFDLQIFNFLDNRLSDTQEFLKTLLESADARMKFIKACKAEVLFDKLADNSREEQSTFDDTYTDAFNNSDDNVVEDEDSLADFVTNYTTEAVPSLEDIENSENIVGKAEGTTDTDVNNSSETGEEKPVDKTDENSMQLESLFNDGPQKIVQEDNSDYTIYEEKVENKRKKSKLIPILVILLVVLGAGYYGYNSYIVNKFTGEADTTPIEQPEFASNQNEKQDAMPVETIENTSIINDNEESKAVTIPSIEQNINTSVYISNLSVAWNVPAKCTTNASLKRYFTRIGKIIQLNLKTELLLVSKVPLSNKVTVELQYKKNAQKFEVKAITYSSGEKTIDDIIKQTVTKVLDAHQGQHFAELEKIQGNPSLVINF